MVCARLCFNVSNLFPSCLVLSVSLSLIACGFLVSSPPPPFLPLSVCWLWQGKVPHGDSEPSLCQAEGLAPWQVCSVPQHQVLNTQASHHTQPDRRVISGKHGVLIMGLHWPRWCVGCLGKIKTEGGIKNTQKKKSQEETQPRCKPEDSLNPDWVRSAVELAHALSVSLLFHNVFLHTNL